MIPFVRELDFEYGRCDQVSPLIRRVIARNPGPFTYLGTGVYIVGRGEVAVIDPGPDLPEHFEALKAALAGERVTHVLVTHHHLDHSPLAHPLAEAFGAPVYGLPAPTATTARRRRRPGGRRRRPLPARRQPGDGDRLRPRLDAGGGHDPRPHLQPRLLRPEGRKRPVQPATTSWAGRRR
jgi:glyoxylase-like metal-dependent hydrolase (beta-lactamase superfamily II)